MLPVAGNASELLLLLLLPSINLPRPGHLTLQFAYTTAPWAVKMATREKSACSSRLAAAAVAAAAACSPEAPGSMCGGWGPGGRDEGACWRVW